MKKNPREMAKSLCLLLILVKKNHAQIFCVANMSFNAIHENKVLAKISGFTVNKLINKNSGDKEK